MKTTLTRHRCGVEIWSGLSDSRAAYAVVLDPYPLTAVGEANALREGRQTYRIWRGELQRRDRWNIPGHPPSHELLVLAEHRCDQPVPATWLLPPAPRTPPRPTQTLEVPF